MVHYKEALFCDQSLKRADTYFEIVDGISSKKIASSDSQAEFTLPSESTSSPNTLLVVLPYSLCLCFSYFAYGTCKGNSEDNGGSPVPPLFRILRFCKKRGVSSEASAKVSSRQSTPTQLQMLSGRDRFQSRKPEYMTGRTRRPTRAAHTLTILKNLRRADVSGLGGYGNCSRSLSAVVGHDLVSFGRRWSGWRCWRKRACLIIALNRWMTLVLNTI